MKVQASDGKSELLNICKGVYSKRVLLTWCEHLITKNSQKIGLSEAFLGIAQNVHPWPRAPLSKSIVYIVYFFLLVGIRSLLHKMIAINSKFTTHSKIFIHINERINLLQIVRFFHS